jgi:hypothetical protein
MVKSLLVGVLLVGLLSGLCLEPDAGTAGQHRPAGRRRLLGPNHATPLPRAPLPSDLLRPVVPALLIAVLARHRLVWTGVVLVERDSPPPRRPMRVHPRAPRGPPAPA